MVRASDLINNDKIQFKQYNPFENIDFVAGIWLALLNKCDHSYFTSWGWISTWIKSLPLDSNIKLIVGFVKNEPAAAFFIGIKKRNKHGFLPSNEISLNSTSDPYYDQLFIEYNSILIDPSISLNVDDLLDYLNSLGWDEFIFPGASSKFVAEFNLLDYANGPNYYMLVDEAADSSFVELEKIRKAGMDYLKLLSSNKRSQIRRSIKQYEIDGDIQIRESESLDEALLMFDNLISLHQRKWEQEGEPGAFSNKYLLKFHKDLIRTRFDQNEIQLLHIYNKRMTIGYLYNFVHGQDVFFYQGGFNYLAGNTYRPGLVSHYFAIMHNAMKNMSKYDFLAGDSAYKSSLSTNSIRMYWIRLIKGKSRFYMEKSLIGIKGKLKSMPRIEALPKNIKHWLASFMNKLESRTIPVN
jgi:hypothetical protein